MCSISFAVGIARLLAEFFGEFADDETLGHEIMIRSRDLKIVGICLRTQ